MPQTIRITQKLVELLDQISAQVFFVNFIKYLSKTAHDARPEQEARHIESHLGKYRDRYYHWYGFGLFKDFIIKNTLFDRVNAILYAKEDPRLHFLDDLKNDTSLRDKYPKIYDMLRAHVIDITSTITPEQIALLDPEYPLTAGTRKLRRRRRKTRRKVWRGGH
jgi:hypothetical protein